MKPERLHVGDMEEMTMAHLFTIPTMINAICGQIILGLPKQLYQYLMEVLVMVALMEEQT